MHEVITSHLEDPVAEKAFEKWKRKFLLAKKKKQHKLSVPSEEGEDRMDVP